MSNVIQFQPPGPSKKGSKRSSRATGKAAKASEEINLRIASLGGEAIENLSDYPTRIPTDDRIRLAKNMDILIHEHRVRPGKLPWERYNYPDKESFNRDLSRMRLPETAEPGRRLVAHSTRWLHLLEMILDYCTNNGENVTLEALAEQLTRGTQFHPKQKIHSRSEKLLYSLKLWAEEIDQQYGLLKTYCRIAEARAEHFQLYMHDYEEDSPALDRARPSMERPVDYFINIPEEDLPLFKRELGSYSDEDWDRFLSIIPEDNLENYVYTRADVDAWNANFQADSTLFCGEDFGLGSPSRLSLTGCNYLPRWFIGFDDYCNLKVLSQYPEDLSKYCAQDPLAVDQAENSFLEVYAHLVLYPTQGMSRIIPYLHVLDEGVSIFEPLREEHLTPKDQKYFTPAPRGKDSNSKLLQGRIEESYLQVREQWIDTAENLSQHPLLAWSEGREQMIDAEIERMTTRTTSPSGEGDQQ